MSVIELFLLALGLSMDAFAVAVSIGLTMAKANLKKALTIGLYFGIFQAGMPVIGYIAATQLTDLIVAYDHWIVFVILCFLGGKMIWGSLFDKDRCSDRQCSDKPCTDRICKRKEPMLTPAFMLPWALATSIDALAVGISFAVLQVNLIPAVSLIGATTLIISMIGVKVGNIFGSRFKSKATFAGGVILILIGLRILLEHIWF